MRLSRELLEVQSYCACGLVGFATDTVFCHCRIIADVRHTNARRPMIINAAVSEFSEIKNGPWYFKVGRSTEVTTGYMS